MKIFKTTPFSTLAALSLILIIASPSMASADSNSTGSTDGSSNTSTSAPKTTSTDSGATASKPTDSSSTSKSTTDSSSPSSSDKSSNSSSSTDKTSKSSEQETEVQIESTNSKDGQQFVSSLSSSESKHSASTRAQNCQAAAHGLTTMLKSLQTNASSFDSKINTVYAQALSYVKSSKKNPANLPVLVATANADQMKAQAAVAALGSLSVNLNCSSSTVATNVAIFRAATAQARTYLVDYQTAVNKILVALEA